MRNDSRQIAFACSIGTALGISLGLGASIQFNFGWWVILIGAVVGGSFAFLAYDFKLVFSMLKQVYRDLCGWEPDWELIKACWGVVPLMTGIMGTVFLIFISLISGGFIKVNEGVDPPPLLLLWLMGTVLLSLAFSSVVVIGLFDTPSYRRELSRDEKLERASEAKEWLKQTLYYFNPVTGWFWAAAALWYSFRWVAMSLIPGTIHLLFRILGFFGKLGWQTFLYILSDKRILCFASTFVAVVIGGMAGYRYGSIFYGMLVGVPIGVALGVLSFEILSVRVLGLVPKTTQ